MPSNENTQRLVKRFNDQMMRAASRPAAPRKLDNIENRREYTEKIKKLMDQQQEKSPRKNKVKMPKLDLQQIKKHHKPMEASEAQSPQEVELKKTKTRTSKRK